MLNQEAVAVYKFCGLAEWWFGVFISVNIDQSFFSPKHARSIDSYKNVEAILLMYLLPCLPLF